MAITPSTTSKEDSHIALGPDLEAGTSSTPHHPHDPARTTTTEKQLGDRNGLASLFRVEHGVVYDPAGDQAENPRWYQRLLDLGVEDNGIKPVPVEQRTLTRYNNLFTVFFTSMLCVLP
jgi:hypothetical protein